MVALELKDQNGDTVIVPVRVAGYGQVNGVKIDSNAIASAYGKKHFFEGLMKEALEEEAAGRIGVFYLNRKKVQKI